jgi:nucleotide-binding universal stress UspA family protein
VTTPAPASAGAGAPAGSPQRGVVIVVGVDGSPTSLHAGAYAAGLARRLQGRLVVVHVQATPTWSMLAPEQSAAVHETLAAVAGDIRRQVLAGTADAAIDVEFITVGGDPYTELCRTATAVKADAVVVGASTHTGHRIMGSVAVRLVRAGRWPVTVVP